MEAVCASVLQQVVALPNSDLWNIPVMSQALSSFLPSTSRILKNCIGIYRRAWGFLKSSCVKGVFMLNLLSNMQQASNEFKAHGSPYFSFLVPCLVIL